GGRNVVGNTKRLAEVVRLEEVAVVREKESLRRRNIHDVAWWTRARRGVRAAELAWCERVPVNYHRRFAADPLVVNECSGREDVRRRRRRGRIPTAAAAARLVQQNCGARQEFDDGVCLARSKWQR